MTKSRAYARVRDGVKDHHPKWSFAEGFVFHHLLLCAIRYEGKGRVGLCEGMTGNKVAQQMGKSRAAIQAALRGLEAGKELVMVGNFTIEFKDVHRGGYTVEPTSYRQATIRRIDPEQTKVVSIDGAGA